MGEGLTEDNRHDPRDFLKAKVFLSTGRQGGLVLLRPMLARRADTDALCAAMHLGEKNVPPKHSDSPCRRRTVTGAPILRPSTRTARANRPSYGCAHPVIVNGKEHKSDRQRVRTSSLPPRIGVSP
jgi:hypothetical protein